MKFTLKRAAARSLGYITLLSVLALSLGSCSKIEPKNCGTSQPLPQVNYEILDASTGRTIFTASNPITPDSVSVIDQTANPDRYGRPLGVVRYNGRVTLGPDYVLQSVTNVPAQGGSLTFVKHLKLGAHDTDTLVIQATFGATETTDCGSSQKLTQLAFTYNNRAVGTYNYAIATDSTSQFGQPYGKLLKLRKRR